MGQIDFTPAVQRALNVRVINTFAQGFQTARVSDLVRICGTDGAVDGDLVAAIIVGKDLALEMRGKYEDKLTTGGVNLYESRAEVANYQRFFGLSRADALWDKLGKLLAISATAGAAAAEQPSRMVEAIVPIGLEAICHTGSAFWATNHKVRPGSSETFANRDDLGVLDLDSYDEAVRRLSKMPDEDGRACASRPSVLATGAGYREIGRDIVANKVPLNKAGGENMRAGDGREHVVVDDWPDTFWGVFDTTTPSDRAFHYAEALPFMVRPLETDPNGAFAIKFNKIEWAVDGFAAMLLGNPRRGFLSVAPGDIATIIANAKAKLKMNKLDFKLL